MYSCSITQYHGLIIIITIITEENAKNNHLTSIYYTTVKLNTNGNILQLQKQAKTSRTWVCIALSDDFKVSGRNTTWSRLTILVVYPATITRIIRETIPINSNTAGVINTRIKTLLLCCRRTDPPSAFCTRVRIDDPARWTADTRRRCCCRTEHGLTVTWLTTAYKHRVILKGIVPCWHLHFSAAFVKLSSGWLGSPVIRTALRRTYFFQYNFWSAVESISVRDMVYSTSMCD